MSLLDFLKGTNRIPQGTSLENDYVYGQGENRKSFISNIIKEIREALTFRVQVRREHCIIRCADDPTYRSIETEVKNVLEDLDYHFETIDIYIPGVGVKHHWYISVLTGKSNEEIKNEDSERQEDSEVETV